MDGGRDSDPYSEDEGEDNDEEWLADLQRIRENNPFVTELEGKGSFERIQNMTDEEWEELGRDLANNTHLRSLFLHVGALTDQRMSFLFRGLTRSNSMTQIIFYENGLSVEGVRSMLPFLQNANKLVRLFLDGNNLQSEGFDVLFRALRDSSIKQLCCNNCGIESIEIDHDYFPKQLTSLFLHGNSINANGCRELIKLLQENSTLKELYLENNQIDDEGVAILVDALQNNTSLKELHIRNNEAISAEGMKLCLQLVNDISSIKATLQSNHTLQILTMNLYDDDDVDSQIQRQIDNALQINRHYGNNNPEAAGRQKVIRSQLHSGTREKVAELQGVGRSLYSEMNPLHLPEVLALVSRHHGQGELYVALKSSIAGVISTVNRKECIHQQMAYHAARLEALGAELAAIVINETEGAAVEIGRSTFALILGEIVSSGTSYLLAQVGQEASLELSFDLLVENAGKNDSRRLAYVAAGAGWPASC